MNEPSQHVSSFLWVVDVDYSTRHHHGAMLRYRNYSKQLVAAGHRVYFLVQSQSGAFDREREFFEQLRAEDAITGFFEYAYSCPRWKTRLATLSLLPGLGNRWMAFEQAALANYGRELIQELNIDVCILSNRQLLFLAPRFVKILPTLVDFGDCLTLYRRRECRFFWNNRDLAGLLGAVRYLPEWYLKERYYALAADANIVVSPVDKLALDKISGTPEKNHVLLNGVSMAKPRSPARKTSGRLIFSGNMDFPPNCESAVWFIDQVFPLVLRAHPSAELVIAGANPVPRLLSRANERIRVTGFVEDMGGEIAASSLYVAPMIMGGGFKNKVVEALTNRTYVAATPLAVEFLGPEAVSLMLVGDTAESLAAHIIRFLSHPEEFESRLSALHSLVVREFSWEHRTAELLDIVNSVFRLRSLGRRLEPAEALPSRG